MTAVLATAILVIEVLSVAAVVIFDPTGITEMQEQNPVGSEVSGPGASVPTLWIGGSGFAEASIFVLGSDGFDMSFEIEDDMNVGGVTVPKGSVPVLLTSEFDFVNCTRNGDVFRVHSPSFLNATGELEMRIKASYEVVGVDGLHNSGIAVVWQIHCVYLNHL